MIVTGVPRRTRTCNSARSSFHMVMPVTSVVICTWVDLDDSTDWMGFCLKKNCPWWFDSETPENALPGILPLRFLRGRKFISLPPATACLIPGHRSLPRISDDRQYRAVHRHPRRFGG